MKAQTILDIIGKTPVVKLNKLFDKLNLTLKLGASNALNNQVIQVYGGPYVGRMLYLSLSYDWKDK